MKMNVQDILYSIDAVLYKMLKNESTHFLSGGKGVDMYVSRIVIPTESSSDDVLKDCNVFLEDYPKSCGNDGMSAALLPRGLFLEDKGLIDIVSNFVNKYPRMQVISVTNTLSDGTEYTENALSVIIEYDPIKLENSLDRSTYNKYIAPKKSLKAFDRMVLYNMATSKYIRDVINNCSTITEKTIIFKNNTIQGRLDDSKPYSMIMLALAGHQRGVYYPPKQLLYSKSLTSNRKRKYSVIGSTVLPEYGYGTCVAQDKIEFEKIGYQLVQEQILDKSFDPGGNVSDTISFISLPNIIDNKLKYQKMRDIINEVKKYKSGIVYLNDTLPEDIIEAFYPCINPVMDRVSKNNNETIFGAIFSNVAKVRYYRNPALQLMTFGTRTGNTKEDIKPINEYMESVGNISDGIDFYIIPNKEIVEDEILIKLANQSLVFICDEFSDLGSLNSNLRLKDNYDVLLDKLIMVGSLYNLEGIMMHPYIKNLMRNNSNDILREIPLSVGKVINNSFVPYNLILDMIQKRIDISNKKSSDKIILQDIIFSDKVQANTQHGIVLIDLGDFTLTQGDIRRIYMSLLQDDISEDIKNKGVSTNIVRRDYSTVEEKIVDGKSSKSIKVITKKYKVSVNQIGQISRMGEFRITVTPLEIKDYIPNIGREFMSRGIHFLCGESQSGKYKSFISVCNNVPSRKSVLLLEPTYSIVEDMFTNKDSINLTIYRGKDVDIIKELVCSRPDIILVYKLGTYDISVLETIVDYHIYTQDVVFVIDGMFADYIRELRGTYLGKLVRYLSLISDQLKVWVNVEEDGVMKRKEDYLFQFLERDVIVNLLDVSSEDMNTYGMRLSETVFKCKQSDPNSLNAQLKKLLSDNKITQEQFVSVSSLLKRGIRGDTSDIT